MGHRWFFYGQNMEGLDEPVFVWIEKHWGGDESVFHLSKGLVMFTN